MLSFHLSSYHFTRGQFWPSGIVVACVCLSVCPSVRPSVCVYGKHVLVRTITHDTFKVGSPNLDHRCKRPWLRSLLFWEVFDLYLQGQIELQSQNVPHFELVCTITHRLFKLGPLNLNQRCKIPWLRSLKFWFFIGLDRSNLTKFQNPVYLHCFWVFEIFVGHVSAESDALFHPIWLSTYADSLM